MTQSLVSILIPCFNAQRYAAEAIRSALAQDYDPIEVIVVDDGSTDGSLNVIRSFARDPRFRFETGPNRGGNAARNRLVELAQGEFVQFLDADDILHPQKISRQIAASGEHDVVLCDYATFSNGSSERIVRYPVHDGDLAAYFVRHSVVISLPLHRREHLVNVGGFDERLPCCQEYDLHFRLAVRSWATMRHLPEMLFRYRRVPGSVSSNEARVFAVKARLIAKWYEEALASGRASDEFITSAAVTLYGCARHLARHHLDEQAREAFKLARLIAPSVQFPGKWPLRVMTRVLGPVYAERCRQVLIRRG